MAIVKINSSACVSKCALCGAEEELRPYNPGGKWVCFSCGMKDEENAKKIFGGIMENNTLIIDAR